MWFAPWSVCCNEEHTPLFIGLKRVGFPRVGPPNARRNGLRIPWGGATCNLTGKGARPSPAGPTGRPACDWRLWPSSLASHWHVGPGPWIRLRLVGLRRFWLDCGPMNPCAACVALSHWLRVCFFACGGLHVGPWIRVTLMWQLLIGQKCAFSPLLWINHLHSNNLHVHVEIYYSKTICIWLFLSLGLFY
jgi:hypothetical protein